MKKNNKEDIKENINILEKQINNKKDTQQILTKKINNKLFENIIIAIIAMIYFYLINLGSSNIETNVFIVDLKVFSVALIIFTIILFEYSYKKDDGNICIHGLEVLVLSIITLFLVYGYILYFDQFNIIVATSAFIFAIYYLVKCIILSVKIRKNYLKNLNDINEIIKKK